MRSLPEDPQLPSVLRTGLAYPAMELQLNPGRKRKRPIHGFGREPCDIATGRGDAGKQEVHSVTARYEIFLIYPAAGISVGT